LDFDKASSSLQSKGDDLDTDKNSFVEDFIARKIDELSNSRYFENLVKMTI
jgi:hypothetical protein